jgi:hypothetical protein
MELRHGYTLANVDRIAAWASIHHRSMACDVADRMSAARLAILAAIYADDPPADHDLTAAASAAIRDLVQDDLRHRGVPSSDHWAGDMSARNFQRYWFGAHTSPSPESAVVERVAATQIMPRLKVQHQRTLAALAATGDRDRAAAAMGATLRTFETYLTRARREFLALWHEHETPSKKWRFDSAPRPCAQRRPCGTPSAYHRHRAHKEPACRPCKSAWTQYLKDREAARSAA